MKRILMFLMLIGIAVPAHAFDVTIPNGFLNLYGSIRLAANYQMLSQGQLNKDDLIQEPLASSAWHFGMQPKSRIGLDINFYNYFGKVEVAIAPDLANPGLYFRQYYAGAKYRLFYLMAGRKITDAETSTYYNDIFLDDGGLQGFGTVAMTIRNTIQFSILNINLAIVDMTEDLNNIRYQSDPDNPETLISAAKTNYLPRLDLSYTLAIKEAFLKVFGTYAMINTSLAEAVPQEATNHAFTFGVLINGSINPGFGLGYLTVSAFYSRNGGLLNQVKVGNVFNGVYSTTNLIPTANIVDGVYLGLNDVDTFGFAGSLQYFVLPSLFIELGGGYQSASSTTFKMFQDETLATSVDSLGIYLQVSWEAVEGLYLVPQVGYYARTTNYYDVALENDPTSPLLNASAIVAGIQVKYEF